MELHLTLIRISILLPQVEDCVESTEYKRCQNKRRRLTEKCEQENVCKVCGNFETITILLNLDSRLLCSSYVGSSDLNRGW